MVLGVIILLFKCALIVIIPMVAYDVIDRLVKFTAVRGGIAYVNHWIQSILTLE